MRGHIICLYAELTQRIPNYHQNAPSYLELCCYNIGDTRVVKHYKGCSRCPYSAEVVFDKSGPGPEVKKLFSCSTQLSMKFFLLINVKMPTIVGILTFMSRKNSILSLSEPEKCCIS